MTYDTTTKTSELQFLVITKVGEGTLASVLGDLYRQTNPNGFDYIRVSFTEAMNYYTPVFHVGEVVVCNESGREVWYPGRKPDKWDVEYEVFYDIEKAIERAREVFESHLPIPEEEMDN